MKQKQVIKKAQNMMDELLEDLGVEAEVSVDFSSYVNAEKEELDYVDINIGGEDLGVLIGYLGRNLRSIQRVFSMMLNRQIDEEDEYYKVVVDVAGYREKREDHLESMAEQVREECLEANEEVDMPPMSAYERRVVHLALKDYEDVITESFGEGKERHVRVLPV